MDRLHSTTIEFGGEQVDLTERDREELETINNRLTTNLDAEIDAQRARGGTEPSSLAQDFGKRQARVSAEIQYRREQEQRQTTPGVDVGGGTFRGPAKPTNIGREPDGEFARPETAPDIDPAPIARKRRTGEFGLDPFDITSSTAGASVDTTFGGDTGGGDERESEREQFNFPAWTVSRAGTYLNKKVDQEDRDDLEPLRQRVLSARTQDGQIELDREEYDTFQRVVREGAESELESLEGREANIFGDADDQREIAREAKQGIINNPPSRLL